MRSEKHADNCKQRKKWWQHVTQFTIVKKSMQCAARIHLSFSKFSHYLTSPASSISDQWWASLIAPREASSIGSSTRFHSTWRVWTSASCFLAQVHPREAFYTPQFNQNHLSTFWSPHIGSEHFRKCLIPCQIQLIIKLHFVQCQSLGKHI